MATLYSIYNIMYTAVEFFKCRENNLSSVLLATVLFRGFLKYRYSKYILDIGISMY